MNLTHLPVLAVDPGQIISLIIFIVAVISWFANLLQGNKDANAVAQRQNRPRRQDPQAELEQFLREVADGKAPQQERKRSAPPSVPKNKQQADRPATGGKGKQNRPSPPPTSKPGERLADTHLQTSALGQGVRSHLSEYMEPNRIEEAVNSDIDASVRRDVGSDQSGTGTKRQEQVHPLIRVLRDPQGMRQAILLNEVLNRRKSSH